MYAWTWHKTGLALIAALCFSVLSGLHAARPVSADVALAVYGYAADDICGFGDEAETRDCPNCTMATSALTLGDVDFTAWQAVSVSRVRPVEPDAPICGGAIVLYQARGPPLFT